MKNFKLDVLSDKCKENCKLYNVMFVLLSACNQDCVHCYIPEHNAIGLPKQKIFDLIDEARELGALNITFTGGEVFVRKDFLELVNYARSKYLRVFVLSNGSLVDEEKAQALIDAHISGFSTTIFSMNENIHDSITKSRGSLKKTLKAIDMLKAGGIEITIKTPLMELNKFEYKDIEKYAKENGFIYRITATIFSKYDGDDTPHDLEIKNDLPQIVKDVDALNNIYFEGRTENKSDIPCSAGFSNICINYDGTVWTCNTLTLEVGNVLKTPLKEIWNKSKVLNDWRDKARKKLDICEKCELKKNCNRCPGLAYMEDGNLYGCSQSAKKIAECRQ